MKHAPVKVTLPNGKPFTLRYLLKEEFDWLMKVPTTVRQAELIRKRNLALLKELRPRTETLYRKLGCPHCRTHEPSGWGLNCSGCAWSVCGKPDESVYQEKAGIDCYRVSFSGLSPMFSGKMVGYSENECQVHSYDPSDQDKVLAVEKTRAFLHGHVEWARAVIATGGVSWPDGTMDWRRPDERDPEHWINENKPIMRAKGYEE